MRPPVPFFPLVLTGLVGILIASRTETLVAKFMDFWFPKTRIDPQPHARAVVRRTVRWYTWIKYGFGVFFIVAALIGKMGWI